MARCVWLCLPLLAAGCARQPQWYALPAQRNPAETAAYGHLGRYIAMDNPNADAHLVRDISHLLEAGAWRWAGEHPQMKFYLQRADNLKFSMDFSFTENTFRDTGPVTLTFLINGHLFDKVRYAQAGEQHFEKPVPNSLLLVGQDNLVAIEPDKIWTSKDDNLKFSFVLVRAGFVD
jgi:hypothetical protein